MRSNSVSKVLFTLLSLMLGTSSVMAQGMGTGSVGAVKPGVRNPHTTGEVPLVPPGHGTVAAPEPLTPGVGVVVGRLKHNDGEGRALAGILARLFAFQDQAQLGQWEAQVQGDGSFQFEGLNTRPGLNYVVSAMYQGVVYLSKGASFSEGEKELAAEVEVFDSMPSPGPLRVLTSQFYIEPDSASGALHVHEVLMYSNPGSKALIGSQNGTVTLRLDMPMGVSNVQPVQGFLPTQVSVSDQALIYAGPIYPGENQVVIGYQVSPRDSWIFRRGYEYPVDKVEVFMPSGGPAVLSPKLSQLESVELQGRRFEHYVGEAAGGGVTFQVGGASLSDDGGPKNVPAESLALGIGLGLIGFVGWPFVLKNRHPAVGEAILARASRQRELISRRDRMLQLVKEMDFEFETGKLSEEDYNRLRAEQKALAVQAIAELEAFEESIVSPPSSSDVAQSDLKFCTACGFKIETQYRFCGGCGEELHHQSMQGS